MSFNAGLRGSRKSPNGRVNGGGDPLVVGQRVETLPWMNDDTVSISTIGRGTVIEIDKGGIPIIEFDTGERIRGNELRWRRV